MDSSTVNRLYSSDHARCLQWFEDHVGQEVRFNDLATGGIKLVTQFKGIFKPQWMPYVLSIRTTEQDRYTDGRIMRQDDGSWRLSYAQEEDSRFDPRELYTNRGIEACMNDGIPIGILRKEHREDPYEVIGLGVPIDWHDGFFTFVSYQPGSMPELPGTPEAEAERLAWPDASQEQIPGSDYDARIRVLAEIARRQGQPGIPHPTPGRVRRPVRRHRMRCTRRPGSRAYHAVPWPGIEHRHQRHPAARRPAHPAGQATDRDPSRLKISRALAKPARHGLLIPGR